MARLTIKWDSARAARAPWSCRLALAVLKVASRLAAWLLEGTCNGR